MGVIAKLQHFRPDRVRYRGLAERYLVVRSLTIQAVRKCGRIGSAGR
jgi:hypothetical protein